MEKFKSAYDSLAEKAAEDKADSVDLQILADLNLDDVSPAENIYEQLDTDD